MTIATAPQQTMRLLVCVQITGEWAGKRRVVWLNLDAISYFAEYEAWRPSEQTRPQWTSVFMTNGEHLKIDAPAAQFAGWLRGDTPRFSEEDYEAFMADRGGTPA